VLRISDTWQASDLGRQRRGNEDSYFARAPLFVVADGMGGARAGEVASGMAVASFDGGLPQGAPPADGLVQLIAEANRRIHEHARADADRAGMGTTLTAAYVGEEDVTVAHVGDSRAYLLRDGDLIRLTRDHSLVGELVARGKLTEEQAESHPQRSVITRALGPEPDVQVDVQVYQARAGDVFLLCSDGLTSMVPEPRLKPLLERAGSLEQAGRELIAAANEAGGRDNITVVLFRLEDVEPADGALAAGATSEFEARGGDGRAGAPATGTMARPTARTRARPLPDEPPPPAPGPRPRRRRFRPPGLLVGALILLAMLVAGFWTASRAVYFVGVDEATGVVTLYRGLPYELPFGTDLYEPFYASGVTLAQVPPERRAAFTDHQLRSKDDAENLVLALERGDIQ
jgi:protein phosphatase